MLEAYPVVLNCPEKPDFSGQWSVSWHLARSPSRSARRSTHERLVEEKTRLPTFYKDFPTDVSPLTRQHRTDPSLAERWDLVAFGTELGTVYSELTDPWSNAAVSPSSPCRPRAATPRRWSSTRTSSTPWNTRCPRPAASASASTAWSCSSPPSPSARPCPSRWYATADGTEPDGTALRQAGGIVPPERCRWGGPGLGRATDNA